MKNWLHGLKKQLHSMNKSAVLFGIIGLLLGAGATFLVMQKQQPAPQPVQQENHSMSNQEMMDHSHDMNKDSKSMDGMVDALHNKSGDEFDKVFLQEMISHHQGAIDMAKMVEKQAEHQELKDMAEKIISAQTNEIEQMKQWQNEWGY